MTWPDIPEWAEPNDLDADVLRDIRALRETDDFVAGHLVAAGALADEEPELAWQHARAARSKGGRIAVVRETVGLVAYRAGEWTEAIAELRAARRMGGGPGHLAILADCERALGHPERALEISRSPEAANLDPEAALEMLIVAAGARRDLGQLDAALALLDPETVTIPAGDAAKARLSYAYADALLASGDREAAVRWFARAADADEESTTDAADRLAELFDPDNDDAPVVSDVAERRRQQRGTRDRGRHRRDRCRGRTRGGGRRRRRERPPAPRGCRRRHPFQ